MVPGAATRSPVPPRPTFPCTKCPPLFPSILGGEIVGAPLLWAPIKLPSRAARCAVWWEITKTPREPFISKFEMEDKSSSAAPEHQHKVTHNRF